ncbi:MAG TPA: AAA family ATPase [Tepidisphaeraceae bacterium]|jgi:predicted ATPase
MIEHITIRNFKSIGDVSVDLSPVTVLIGRSGVGKSNFLRAIRFLRNYLLRGDTAIQQEGGWPRIWPFGTRAPLLFSIRFAIPGYTKPFSYTISWASHPQNPAAILLNAERLALGGDVIFDRNERTWVKWPGDGPPPAAESRVYINSFPTLSEAVLAYTAWTSGIGWHDFPATVFTQGASNTGPELNGLDDSASNFLGVIRDITKDLRNQHARRQIVARIKQINPTVDSLELDSIIQPQRVVVAHKLGDRRIGLDLSQESDGFRRYYAHLLALYQTPPKQVLMFEEPENGIYPGALRNLAEEFKSAPSAARGQVLLTTQSPELLDGFAPEELRVVDLNEHQLTRIGPLDPDQADALRTQLLEPGELLTVDSARPAGASV